MDVRVTEQTGLWRCIHPGPRPLNCDAVGTRMGQTRSDSWGSEWSQEQPCPHFMHGLKVAFSCAAVSQGERSSRNGNFHEPNITKADGVSGTTPVMGAFEHGDWMEEHQEPQWAWGRHRYWRIRGVVAYNGVCCDPACMWSFGPSAARVTRRRPLACQVQAQIWWHRGAETAPGTVWFYRLGNCEDCIHTISAALRDLWLRQDAESSRPKQGGSREVAGR